MTPPIRPWVVRGADAQHLLAEIAAAPAAPDHQFSAGPHRRLTGTRRQREVVPGLVEVRWRSPA